MRSAPRTTCSAAAIALAGVSIAAASAAARRCESLSSLGLPDVTSISATSIPANTFSPPPAFPGWPPVPIAFCRVQITVEPQIHIEVWLPPAANWNRRFQAEGGGGMPVSSPIRRSRQR
jgi:hypothetical protein